MPFPPTPSNTPSNTPTPSVTPSVTPTITPSNTSCPNPSPSATPTITPTTPPCPCVCGAQVTNLSSTESINYSYLNCDDVSFSGTIAPSATLVLTCIEPEILVKWGSITTSGPSTIVYGECVAPTPTPTATPTITPTATTPPVIYVGLCLPPTVPEDGRVYICIQGRSENNCTGSTTNFLDFVGLSGDLYLFVDGEWVDVQSLVGCNIYSGQSCNCDCYADLGAELSGTPMSATTIFYTTGSTQATYLQGPLCNTPDCSQCIPSPTPTPTLTQTPTPSPTPTPTPIPCDCYRFQNETGTPDTVDYVICGGSGTSESVPAGQTIYRCVAGGTTPTSASITITQCSSNCTIDDECTSCT